MGELCSNDPGHMTKLATMPIYGKTFKNLLRNRSTDIVEAWYSASVTRVLLFVQMMTLGVDLEPFTSKVKFGPLCFCMGKAKTMDFSETIVVHDIKVGRCRQLNEYMNLYDYGHVETVG